jgi:hypothetical protein
MHMISQIQAKPYICWSGVAAWQDIQDSSCSLDLHSFLIIPVCRTFPVQECPQMAVFALRVAWQHSESHHRIGAAKLHRMSCSWPLPINRSRKGAEEGMGFRRCDATCTFHSLGQYRVKTQEDVMTFLGHSPRIPVPGSAHQEALSRHWHSRSGNMYNDIPCYTLLLP